MLLKSLTLTQFKNYPSQTFQLEQFRIALLGKNGSGKTNFLDALHHLALGRSLFHKQDAQQIQHGTAFYRLDAQIQSPEKTHRLELVYALGEKKNLWWDGLKTDKITDHVGRLPLVYILPDEPFHMHESSEWRRQFFDSTLAQTFPEYLHHLANYRKALTRRNASLQYFAERRMVDYAFLDALDYQLMLPSAGIHIYRSQYLPQLVQSVRHYYQWLSDGSETVDILRKTELSDGPMDQILQKNRTIDIEQQRTIGGLHRDDYLFFMDQHPLKKVGSQGQQKSFLLALKFAQYAFIQQFSLKKPWLLMDDIFDKLDDDRIEKLLQLVEGPEMGQVFLTDARPERSQSLLGERFQSLMIGQNRP